MKTISIKINMDEKTGELSTNLTPINPEKDKNVLEMLASIVNEFANKSAAHAIKNNEAVDDDIACDYESKIISFVDFLNNTTKKSNSYDFLNDKAEMIVDNIADEISDLIRSCFPSGKGNLYDDEFEDDYFDSFPPELANDSGFKSLFESMLIDDEEDDIVIEDDEEEDYHPHITVSNNLFDDPVAIDNNLNFIEYKGFNIRSIDGLKTAKIWLESADPDELLYGEPTGDPFDICMGDLRRTILIDTVEKEIKRLSKSQ